MKRLLITGLIVMMALAACGGDDDDNGENGTNGDATETTFADDDVLPGNPAPEGDTDLDDTAEEPVQIGPIYYSVSGAPEQAVELEADQWTTQVMGDFYVILFEDQEESITVSLEDVPQNLEPGTYDIGPNAGPKATLQIGDIADDEVTFYEIDANGTLTITEVDRAISGSFEFTATESRTDEGEEAETATVTGEFAYLPLP